MKIRCSRSVFPLFALITGVCGTRIDAQSRDGETFLLSGILHSGMEFKDLLLPTSAAGENGRQIVKAAIAEVLEPNHLLQIRGFEFILGLPESGFHLKAPTATFDLKAKRLEAALGFRANGRGFSLEGASLSGLVDDRRFEITGLFQVNIAGPPGNIPWGLPSVLESGTGPFVFTNAVRPVASLPESMTAIRLLQEFSPHLHGFDRFWRSLCREPQNASSIHRKYDWHMVSWQGGGFDLARKEVNMAGGSALIGPGGFLSSSDGIVWRQEQTSGSEESNSGGPAMETRIHGGGGVKVWMESAESEVTWVKADAFEYVSALGNVLQFEGGPVRFSRKGIEVHAEESWQFVRLFDGNRLVLSPGSWHTVDAN